jgi:hypothetical protein
VCFLEGGYAGRHPARHVFALALGRLGPAQSDGMLEAALEAGVLELHASAVVQTRSVALVKGLGRSAALRVCDVLGHVGPVVDLFLQVGLNLGEQLLEGQGPVGMRPSALPRAQLGEVVVLEVVQGDDSLTPLVLVEADTVERLAVEHGPVAAQRDAALLQHLAQHHVAAEFALDVLAEEMRPREVLVLAKHAAKSHDLAQRAARYHVAAAAVREGGLLLGEDGRAEVVGGARVEVRQEAVQVVVVDVCVELDEDEPHGVGAHVRGPLHHGQELVLVEAAALVRLLLGHVVVLDAVVDVEVGVVELVLGAQVGEGVGDVDAAMRVLAVREDEQVVLARRAAGEELRQLRARLDGPNLQHHRHVVHDAGAEGRALAAKGHRGRAGGRPLDEQVVAALAVEEGAEQAGQERREDDAAQHQHGAQQAQRGQAHHHGGEVVWPCSRPWAWRCCYVF